MKARLMAVIAMTFVLTLAAGAALSSTATPVVRKREVRQQTRIAQGVKSGELTPGETARLEHGQAHVARVEGRAKSDGVVTPAERARLQHAQNVQSRRICRLKHNDRTR